ncbi:beta-N-acetylhexosaminidase (plasmid) [Fulvitalea axinellae]|uniref:beta-N-acetylhexosaminidase n=1 Tax=Fulvitalea axinellae TaxID=1182444 RepID=A0AAU9CVT6_9BACT|nr:beta-N-acetylhexosaminidase [Fulvitalea axinellae]
MFRFKIHTLVTLFFLSVLAVACQAPEKPTELSDITIIPKPAQIVPGKGHFVIDASTSIVAPNDKGAKLVADMLAEKLAFATGHKPKVVSEPSSKAINLKIDKTLGETVGPEGYKFTSTSGGITIEAVSGAGLYYGTQTLRQLLPAQLEQAASKNAEVKWTVPGVTVIDQPRFEYRGMHMDVSRHFFSKAYVKKFIDYMALYKFNKFHFHLTDDQGWRLEIKQYPELTEEGAYRIESTHDVVCNERAKEDETFVITKELFTERNGKTMYGGFYTQEDMKEMIAYAQARNITIIPEIDMPGHFKAAVDAYGVSCTGKGSWSGFSSPLCAGKEEAFTLVENILTEVCELFPSEYIHIGADEVNKSYWEKCPKCQKRIKEEKLEDEHELQAYFVHRVEKFLNGKGKKMIGWDEILEGGMSKTATMMYWRGWVKDAPKKAVEQGNNVIMTPTSHCYFDYQQNAGSLEHVYGFDPVAEDIPAEAAKLIQGGQANLWTEWIPSEDRMDYMAMPRMIALAEAVWTPKSEKNWDDFAARVTKHFDRLDVMDVHYRVPDMDGMYANNVFIDKKTVKLNASMKGLNIRYTVDGSEPTAKSKAYEGPFEVDKSMTLKAKVFTKMGRGSDTYTTILSKETYRKGDEVKASKAGLDCAYYEYKEGIKTVDALKDMKPKKNMTVATIEVPESAAKKNIGLVLTGYIKIPTDKVYTFRLRSDDGSKLYIGGKQIVDNDGPHGMKPLTAQAALGAGLHPIRVEFYQGGGASGLNLKVLDDNGEEIDIPADWFVRK